MYGHWSHRTLFLRWLPHRWHDFLRVWGFAPTDICWIAVPYLCPTPPLGITVVEAGVIFGDEDEGPAATLGVAFT